MKNIIRTFVFSLVVTGAVASAHLSASTQPVMHAKVSAMPVPSCPPDGSTSCGICSYRRCTVSGN
jgi:hypothetical protein